MVTTNANQAEIGLCLLVASADDDLAEEELAELRVKLRATVEVDTNDAILDALIDSERRAIAEQGTEAYLEKLITRIPEDQRRAALASAVDVAFADGLDASEDKFVRRIAKALGIPEEVVNEMAGPPI
jgi:tellurite resistance protein